MQDLNSLNKLSPNVTTLNDHIYIDSSLVINKDIFESIQDIAICTMCTGLVLNPKQCEKCEYLFCGVCVNDWISKSKSCPFKCQDFNLKEPSRIVKNILSKILINCPKNCSSQIEYDKILYHYNSCKGNIIECPTCGSRVNEDLVKRPRSYAQINIENELLKKKISELELLIKKNNSQSRGPLREKKFKVKEKPLSEDHENDNSNLNGIENISIDFSQINLEKPIPNYSKKSNFQMEKALPFLHKENLKVVYLFSCCNNEYDCISCHNQFENHGADKILNLQCLQCHTRSDRYRSQICYGCGLKFFEDSQVRFNKPIQKFKPHEDKIPRKKKI